MTTTTEGKTRAVHRPARDGHDQSRGLLDRVPARARHAAALAMDDGHRVERTPGLHLRWRRRLAGYHQGRTIGGLNGNRGNLEDGQFGDYPIAKGYALAGGSLNVFGTYANDVVSAETMMMVKEHFIEEFGPIRCTIGSGRSGGSMQQHLIANNYPGLLDAIVPTASFADTMTFQTALLDCELLDHAMTTSKQPFTTDQKTAISGYSHWDYCTNNKLRYAAVAADINCDPQTRPAVDAVRSGEEAGWRPLHVSGRVRQRLRQRPEDRLRAAAVRQRRRSVRPEAPSTTGKSISTSSSTSTVWPAATTSTATSCRSGRSRILMRCGSPTRRVASTTARTA